MRKKTTNATTPSSDIAEAHQYDKIIRENINEVFIPFVIKSLGFPITLEEFLPDKLFTTEEREMDLLLKLRDENGRVFLFHVEFQSNPDYEMIWRMLEYHGMISRKYKLPIIHLVVDLDSNNAKIKTQLEPEFFFKGFEIIKLYNLDYNTFLSSQIPAEVILAILCNFKGKNPEAVIRLIAKRLKEVTKSDSELKKYINQLNVLSNLRNLRELTKKTISAMPIIFDFDNDVIAIEAVNKSKRKAIEKMLLNASMNSTQIAYFLDVEEDLVLQIKKEMEQRKIKK